MLSLQEVADFLTNELNVFDKEYQFKIFSEVSCDEYLPEIIGVISSLTPILPPVANIMSVDYNLNISMSVPAPKTNFQLERVEKVIGQLVKKWNGKEYEFSTGKGILTFTLTKTNAFKTEYGIGDMVPLDFNLKINYSENVITSGSKVWLLNDIVIPYTNENIILEKTGKTNMINGKEFNQTLLTSQMKYYHFVFPYTDSELCKMLQQDILTGSANKTYTLKYYDGLAFTENNPFTTTVSIFKNADTGSERPKNGVFNITFADADDGNASTRYYLALIDWQFDSQTENTRYFESLDEQRIYFDGFIDTDGKNGLIRTGAEWDEIKAPNLDSIDLTSQYYKNTRNYDLFDLVKKNYAIIKVIQNYGKENEKTTYFFYWTNNAQIGAENQIFYDLRLDTVQTYLFNPDIEFTGSLIQQAHINRWIDNGDGTVSFNGKADSKLFEREEIKDVAKRLVSRGKLKLVSPIPENDELVNWLNQNVIAWVYICVTKNQNYNFIDKDAKDIEFPLRGTKLNEKISSTETSTSIPYPNATLCYPITKDNRYFTAVNSSNNSLMIRINENEFQSFLKKTKISYVYTIKISNKPPFDLSIPYNYHIDQSITLVFHYYDITNYYAALTDDVETVNKDEKTGEIIISSINNSLKIIRNGLRIGKLVSGENNSVVFGGLFYYTNDYVTPVQMTTSIELPKIKFNKNDIIGVDKNIIFNPKLNDTDYKELNVTMIGSGHKYSIQKLNTQKPLFEYIEAITLDISKCLVRILSSDNVYIFNKDYSTSYNGLISTNDLSLPIASDKLDQYLADNKNAYLSFQNQQNYNVASTTANIITRTAGSMASLNPLNIASSTISSTGEVAQLGLRMAYESTQFNLTLDNMRNSPDSIVNANGSALFASLVSDFGIYAELYEGLESELEIANDIMFQNGYVYNQFGNIKDFMNIRKYFNFVKAIIGNIGGIPLSNSARVDLRQRFAGGIRFWNSDNVQYELENYEKSLEQNN